MKASSLSIEIRTLLLAVCMVFLTAGSDKLANVLIIGDSISIGYFPYVEEALQGKANVIHNKGNAGHTGMGLEKLESWLGNTKWDIIHFNWGLWDLCYRSPESKVQGNRDKINGTITFTPQEYSQNLENLVRKLKMTGAKLIFAETTYVPKGEAGRFYKDDIRYNRVARSIMEKYDVQINHLNDISKKVHKEYGKGKGDVHYTQDGYILLSEPVIEILLESINKAQTEDSNNKI